MQFILFSDNLADLKVPQLCAAVKAAGFDGIDLTMRPGGHVDPARAELGLAEAARAAERASLTIPMVTTAVTDATDRHADAVFAAAAHYGARRLKLGYWVYKPFGSLARQIDEARSKLERIARLAQKYHVLPCVHCHSGGSLSGGGMPLYLILKDFKPAEVGAYVDPMHMTIEGGLTGWEMALDLLAPWVALVGMKNFRWVAPTAEPGKPTRAVPNYAPLADGQAALPEFVHRLQQLKYDGIMSLHSEYKGPDSFRNLSTPELLAQSAEDLKYLKTLVGR